LNGDGGFWLLDFLIGVPVPLGWMIRPKKNHANVKKKPPRPQGP